MKFLDFERVSVDIIVKNKDKILSNEDIENRFKNYFLCLPPSYSFWVSDFFRYYLLPGCTVESGNFVAQLNQKLILGNLTIIP